MSALLAGPARCRRGCAEACGREPGPGGSGQRGDGERAAGGPARCRPGVVGLRQVGVGNEAVVSAAEALHDADGCANGSLGQVGVGNEAVVSALLEALHDADSDVRGVRQRAWGAWKSKRRFNCARCSWPSTVTYMIEDNEVRRAALVSIRQLLDGRPIPGYQWVPLRKRQARLRSLSVSQFYRCCCFTSLSCSRVTLLDPNSLISRWVTWLSILASIVSVIGVTLHDLWERKQSN